MKQATLNKIAHHTHSDFSGKWPPAVDKKTACEKALSEVSELYRFGGKWRFNYYEKNVNAWRESVPREYSAASFARRVQLIACATAILHPERIDSHCIEPGDFVGGKWQSYV